MEDDPIAWGGALWAAADLVTPMTIRVAATLRLADLVLDAPQNGPRPRA